MQPIDPIINPTIYIGSFEWREPVTTLTDFLTALVCLYALIRFQGYKGERSINYNYYKSYFIFFFLGMLSAAWFGHGLAAYVTPQWKAIGWVLSDIALLFLGLGSLKQIEPNIKKTYYNGIKWFYFSQFVVFVFLMVHPRFHHFIYAQLSSVISLVGLILPMHIFNYFKTKQKGSLIIIIAIACGILPAIFFNTQISISRWYNYHDISHTLMAGIMFIMYLGVSRLSMIDKLEKH